MDSELDLFPMSYTIAANPFSSVLFNVQAVALRLKDNLEGLTHIRREARDVSRRQAVAWRAVDGMRGMLRRKQKMD